MTEQNTIILSAGAAQALSTVAARVLKRPRAVLSANDEVKEAERQHAKQVCRERDAKRVRLAFEANARVVPDAATDAARERTLRATATKGAVALFNAVTNAQRGMASEKPVDKDMFMGMLKRGVAQVEDDEVVEEKADWLKDDYLTKNSRKLRHFDNVKLDDSEDDDEENVNDEQEHEYDDVDQFDDEAEFEHEDEVEEESEDDDDE